MSLRDDMVIALADWQNAVPAAWQEALGDPNLQAEALVNAQDEEGAYPPYPPLEADEGGRGLLRPFAELRPDEVRVVILGQDPYTQPDRATGRSFEDGASVGLDNTSRPALRHIVQSAVAPDLVNGRENWQELCASMGALPPRMDSFFDRLQRRGVLFINASWTFTHKQHQEAHKEVWRPVTRCLLQHIAASQAGTVFLLLGRDASDSFKENVPAFEELPRVRAIVHPHPTAFRGPTYFNGVNPFLAVNRALNELGGEEIQWWEPERVD